MRVTRVLATFGYLFLLSPLVVVTILSFSSAPYLTFPPPGISLRWYVALLGSQPVLQAAGKSVLLALLVTSVAVLAGFPAALAIARGMVPGRVAGLLALPLLLPTLVIGLALLMVLQPLGLLATWPGLALGHLMVVLPFVVRLLTTALASLPASLEDAAATLGAGPLKAFLLVTLPLAAPGAVAAATLSFLLSFDETVISPVPGRAPVDHLASDAVPLCRNSRRPHVGRIGRQPHCPDPRHRLAGRPDRRPHARAGAGLRSLNEEYP